MTIIEFLIYLGEHPYKVIEAREDPFAVMREVGLSEEDQALLTSGDMGRIRAAIADGTPAIPDWS